MSRACFRGFLLFSLFLFLPSFVSAQTRTEAPYLIPQIIFVGDPGRLVVPLGRAFARVEPFVWEKPEKLPEAPDIVFQRMELERRGNVSRLIIDFIPYAPGLLSIPPLEFRSQDANAQQNEVLTLSGLEINVASILGSSQIVLAEPASPLAVPGTSLLVYGTMVLILFLLAMGIVVSLWGRNHFREFLERLRRRFLLRNMVRFLRRLSQECRLAKNANPAVYLTRLSTEFREFLSLFTGVNCRSLTAGEFLEITSQGNTFHGTSFREPFPASVLGPSYLCELFRYWDVLRFSGRGMEMADLFVAMTETEKLITTLDKAETERISAGKPATEKLREAV